MNLQNKHKISIIGNSAAGKSTFAHRLGQSLNIDVHSVDKIYWLSGWKLRNQDDFNQLHAQWLAHKSWIIEGVGHWESMQDRLAQSDSIIFLDIPVEVCKKRALSRIEQEKLFPNKYITEGCHYADVKQRQMELIDYFHNEFRPKLMQYLLTASIEKLNIISNTHALDAEFEK